MRKRTLPLLLALLGLTATIVVAQTQVVQGQSVTIEVRLTDENGDPIAGVTVHFLDETDGVEIGTDVTDSSGYASVTWDTSSASAGVHSILIWTEEADYVESTQTRVSIEILTPAELRLSVSAPAAVRPGQSFVVKATVSNAGQAAAQGVVVSLDGQSQSVGDLPGGASSTVEFTVNAPDDPGDYSLTLQATGTEWGTGRSLSASSRVYYHVKREGIALEVRAPYSVREGETFAFSIDLSNVGEDSVSLAVTITLEGAEPGEIEDSVDLNPDSSATLTYNATAGSVDEIEIVAVAEGGGLRASGRARVVVIPAPPPQTPPPSPPPTPPSTTSAPLTSTPPPSATSPLSTTPPPTTPPPTETPEAAVTVEVNLTAPVQAPASARVKASLGASGFVILVMATARRLWGVREP